MMAVLLAQAVATTPPYPVPMAVTPESRTAPIVHAVCKIADPHGREYQLSMHQSGGRGYRVTRDGNTHFPRTPLKQEIVGDTARIFDGFEFELDSASTWPGVAKALKRPGQIVQMQTFSAGEDGKYAILLRRRWPKADVNMLGYCDVKKTPQAPLNAAETEEAIRQ